MKKRHNQSQEGEKGEERKMSLHQLCFLCCFNGAVILEGENFIFSPHFPSFSYFLFFCFLNISFLLSFYCYSILFVSPNFHLLPLSLYNSVPSLSITLFPSTPSLSLYNSVPSRPIAHCPKQL